MRYQILKKLGLAGDVIAGTCVMLMVVLITVEVLMRTFLDQSLMIADEFCGYLMGVAVYFGAVQAYHTGGFVQVKMIYNKFGQSAQKALDFLFDAAFLVFNSYVTWYFFGMLVQVVRFKSKSSFISQTPLAIPMGAVMVGMALFELSLIIKVVLSAIHYKNPPAILADTVSQGGSH